MVMAWAALLGWMLGLELLPNLHMWHHDAEHTHHVDGTIVSVQFGPSGEGGPHRHHDGEWHIAPPRVAAPTTVRQKAIHTPARGHVANGLAHRAVAIAAAPLLAPVPVRCILRDVELALVDSATLCAVDPLAPSARGPPSNRYAQ